MRDRPDSFPGLSGGPPYSEGEYFWRENLDWSLDKLSAQLRIYHGFDEGISITFGIYIIHKLVCITCRYQFG